MQGLSLRSVDQGLSTSPNEVFFTIILTNKTKLCNKYLVYIFLSFWLITKVISADKGCNF